MLKPHFLKSLEITELPVHQKTRKGSRWWRVCSRWKADGPELGCHLWSFPIWNANTKLQIIRNSLKSSKINSWVHCTIHKVTGACQQAAQSRDQLPSRGEASLTQNKMKNKGLPQMGASLHRHYCCSGTCNKSQSKNRLSRSVLVPFKRGKIPTLSESYPLILYHCRMFLFILKCLRNCTQCMSLHGWFRAILLSSAPTLSQRPPCCLGGIPWQMHSVFWSRSVPGGRSFIIHGRMR